LRQLPVVLRRDDGAAAARSLALDMEIDVGERVAVVAEPA
jgi:hypothetical protein